MDEASIILILKCNKNITQKKNIGQSPSLTYV